MCRLLIVAFISGFTGIYLIRCASVPIQEKEARQIAELDTVENDIDNSSLPPEVKARDKQALQSGKVMIREQGQTITKQAETIQADKKYRHIVWAGATIIGLSILGGLYLKFKP